MKSINYYQSKIHTYRQRRLLYKEKYGVTSLKYKKLVKSLHNKITMWQSIIRKREKKMAIMLRYDDLIQEYIGISIRGKGAKFPKKYSYARFIFFKCCIENGVQGNFVSEYCGFKSSIIAARQRLYFTRAFKTNPFYYKTWLDFKNYINLQAA